MVALGVSEAPNARALADRPLPENVKGTGDFSSVVTTPLVFSPSGRTKLSQHAGPARPGGRLIYDHVWLDEHTLLFIDGTGPTVMEIRVDEPGATPTPVTGVPISEGDGSAAFGRPRPAQPPGAARRRDPDVPGEVRG